MAKPALYIDLTSGANIQFAAGREDTLQIQNLVALDPASPVNLFIGAASSVSLGGPAANTAIDGSTISITSGLAQDITLTSRGSTLTFNQVGNEFLVGFAPAVTSIVAAINDVKSAVGLAGLQGAYDIFNAITMSPLRNLVVTTSDGGGNPSNFILRNTAGFNFVRTDTTNDEVKLGDGSNIYVNFSGQVDSDIWFDPTLSKLHYFFSYIRSLGIEGVVTPDQYEPVQIRVIGKVNPANTAGADVALVAETNTVGPIYGGFASLQAYYGDSETGATRAVITAGCTDTGTGYSSIGVIDGQTYHWAYTTTPTPNTPNINIISDGAPIRIAHDGNATWEIDGADGTVTFTDTFGRVYLYVDAYTAGGRVGLGSNVWPVAGNGQYFRNLIGTVTNVAIPVANQADVVLLANTRAAGPDRTGICVWNADPNGVCAAPRGSFLLRTDNGTAYINSDDATTWAVVGMGTDTLQEVYDENTSGGVQIGLDDLGKDLIIETKDTATHRNFILRRADDSLYIRTDAQNSTVIIGNTSDTTPVSVLLDSNLSWVRDANDRSIRLYNESLAQKRLLSVVSSSGVADQYGGDLELWATSTVANPGAIGGGQVEIASKSGGVTRSYIQLHQDGGVVGYGAYVNSYGRLDLVIDATSSVGSPVNITNTRGPTTITATGGTLSIDATGQSCVVDCSVLDVNATAASQIATSATLLVSAANDLTFGGRGATITLNQLGEENLDPGFTSTSLIGALNELLGSGGVGTLQQAYNLGNTIPMTTARPILFTTWDAAGPSNFVVQNALGRIFLQSDTALGSVRIGDALLNDVVLSGRGASLTFNQVANTALVGFAPATTSIVAALNELKAAPSGGVTATYTTAEAVVVGDAIYITGAGTVGIADYTTALGKSAIIGFSTQSVGIGLPCVVALAGEVTTKTALIAGDVSLPAFLTATGGVTTTPPAASGLTLARLGIVTASGAGTSKVAVQIAAGIDL